MISFLIQLQKVTEIEMKNRAEVYLCFKRHIFQQLHLIERIVRLNLTIKVGRMFMLSPKTMPLGKSMIKIAQKGQNLFNNQYNLSSKKCRQNRIILPSPFGLKLKRNALGLALLKRKKWKIIISQKKGFSPFQLEAHFQSPQRNPSHLSLNYWEKSLYHDKQVLQLNPLFGVVSSF